MCRLYCDHSVGINISISVSLMHGCCHHIKFAHRSANCKHRPMSYKKPRTQVDRQFRNGKRITARYGVTKTIDTETPRIPNKNKHCSRVTARTSIRHVSTPRRCRISHSFIWCLILSHPFFLEHPLLTRRPPFSFHKFHSF